MELQVVKKKEYLQHIQSVYPHFQSETEYKWAFCRSFGGKVPDLFVLRDENGEIAAGSAITYRQLSNHNGFYETIGIMTGSWTLPKFRNQGYFTKIIQHSADLARQRGAAALTAFVTESNASARRLLAAGSMGIPAFYIFSRPDFPNTGFSRPITPVGSLRDIWRVSLVQKECRCFERHNECRFVYSQAAFRKQFYDRPLDSRIHIFSGQSTVIEESHDAMKVLLVPRESPVVIGNLLQEIASWAAETEKKKIYYYTTSVEEKEVLASRGFSVMPGWFTILPLDGRPFFKDKGSIPISIQLGDKM